MNGVETSPISVDFNSLKRCTEIAVCAYNIVDRKFYFRTINNFTIISGKNFL